MKTIITLTIMALVFNKFLDKKYKHIHYNVYGSGTPLVLIHPFPSDSTLYTPQISSLSSQFTLILIDMYGFGLSDPTDGTLYPMESYADDVSDVLDELKITKAIIGGESMGGWITLSFLKKYPSKVIGLILSNTDSIVQDPATVPSWQASIDRIKAEGPTGFVLDFVPNAMSENATEDQVEFLKSVMLKQKANGMVSALQAVITRTDNSHTLLNIDFPTLIITGDGDKVIAPVESEFMSRLPKNAKLVVFESGHITSVERAEDWNQAVLDFFGSN